MNRATRTNVAVLSAIFGISGMSHGFFEILQGNVSTNGLFISFRLSARLNGCGPMVASPPLRSSPIS